MQILSQYDVYTVGYNSVAGGTAQRRAAFYSSGNVLGSIRLDDYGRVTVYYADPAAIENAVDSLGFNVMLTDAAGILQYENGGSLFTKQVFEGRVPFLHFPGFELVKVI